MKRIALLILATLSLSSASAYGQLAPMLKITWSRGPNLPQGFQDSDGGFIGDTLITAGGFCSGGLKLDNEKKPGVYPRGFLNKAWALDLSAANARWQALPPFPGVGRQGLFAAIVNEELYVWGGFNYDPPCTYDDGYRLSHRGTTWSWEAMPKLPWKITSAAAAVIGSKIFVCGGADFDAKVGYYTDTDRDLKLPRLGARLLVLDTQKLDAGWKELPQFPGTPRFTHAMQAIDGTIYILGGAARSQPYTVVDNWKLDPPTGKWTRLGDLPIASGNFPKSSNLVYANRYILLPGGYQYGAVLNPDGTTRPPYGKPSTHNPKSGLCNDVFVYDTQTDTFGSADKLPIDNNLPMTVVRDERIYLLGGETGGGVVDGEYYGHHPDLLLIGQISLP